MNHMMLKCLLTVCLAGVAISVAPEPEPDVYTTTFEGELAPAPAPDAMAGTSSTAASTTGAADSTTSTLDATAGTSTTLASTNGTADTTTTSTPLAVVHTVALTVNLNNISAITNETALMWQILKGVTAAAGSGANVEITVHFMTANAVYGGFPSIDADDIIAAYAAMTGINISQVTVNNATHSSLRGGRRLSSDAEISAKVENTPGTDVVAESQRIIAQNSAIALTNQLKIVNASSYENVSCTLPNPPIAKLSATTVVTGTQSAPTEAAIRTQVGGAVGGGATVTASVTTVTQSPMTPTVTTTTTDGIADTSHAPIAPMMTIWATVFAFAMS